MSHLTQNNKGPDFESNDVPFESSSSHAEGTT